MNLVLRSIFVPVLLITVLLSINMCQQAKNDDTNTTDNGTFKLDYTSHKLPRGIRWVTNTREPVIASPQAKKGGMFSYYIPTFPLTFRTVGPDSNNFTRSYFLNNHISLLDVHANTEKPIPGIATHWAFDRDKRTMYFKINKKARWSDGTPITADDFIYTLEFMRSKHIMAPWYNDYYTREIEKIVKYDDHTISISATKKRPDLWYYISLSPTPKHYYGILKSDFVRKYNFAKAPNSGPYVLGKFKKGKYLIFERKKDWWAKDLKYNRNRFNVDRFKLVIIQDSNVAFEYLKKGEIDAFGINTPVDWHKKAKGDLFDSGYIHKQWIYIVKRNPTWGFYLNLDMSIFKDRNVRYALAHAINFDILNKQVLYNEAERLNRFFSGYGVYSNKRIKARKFNIK
ncbi:ABC transporter substrate-binding protein, partial [Spirochaetota bacterium]